VVRASLNQAAAQRRDCLGRRNYPPVQNAWESLEHQVKAEWRW